MSRRLVWLTLGVVAALLVGTSYLASPSRWAGGLAAFRALPWRAWLGTVVAEVSALLKEYPLALPVAAGALVVLVVVALLIRRRRRRRPAASARVPFERALEEALAAEPPAAGPSRGHRVATLAQGGHAVAEIARRTRLSQDAVRTLLGGGAGLRPAPSPRTSPSLEPQ